MGDDLNRLYTTFIARIAFAIGLVSGTLADQKIALGVAAAFFVVAVVGGLRDLHKWSREP